jgi:hypothetical protein
MHHGACACGEQWVRGISPQSGCGATTEPRKPILVLELPGQGPPRIAAGFGDKMTCEIATMPA